MSDKNFKVKNGLTIQGTVDTNITADNSGGILVGGAPISVYSAPTIGSTLIASGATVTSISGLTLDNPTLTSTTQSLTSTLLITNALIEVVDDSYGLATSPSFALLDYSGNTALLPYENTTISFQDSPISGISIDQIPLTTGSVQFDSITGAYYIVCTPQNSNDNATVASWILVASGGNSLSYPNIAIGTLSNSNLIISATELGYLDGLTSSIQTQLDAKAVLPTQTGNSGKFLTTDGTNLSWGSAGSVVTTSTISTNTANTIDTVALSGFTTMEYTLSIKQGTKVRSSKIFVQNNGSSVDFAEYGVMSTGGLISGVSVSVSLSSTNSVLQVTIADGLSQNATIKFTKDVI